MHHLNNECTESLKRYMKEQQITGFFAEDCYIWMLRPPLQHTWVNFKTEFTLAYQSLRETQAITRSSGFQNDNAAIEQMQTQAIDALAAENEENTIAVDNMATTNTTLADQVQALEILLRALRAENARNRNGGRGRRGGRGGDDGRRRANGCHINNSTHYYWNHGRTRNEAHTSPICTYPADNHDVRATFKDQRGGSTRGCEDQDIAHTAIHSSSTL